MAKTIEPKAPTNAEIVRLLEEIRTELQELGRRQDELAAACAPSHTGTRGPV